MGLRNLALLVAASAMIFSATGCEPPSAVSPVAPPGFAPVTKEPEVAAADVPQAIGEQASPSVTGKQTKVTTTAVSPSTPIGKPTTTASGLTYETLKEGTGAEAKSGQEVTIHYTGTLADGSVFDSSRENGRKPLVVAIGTGRVVPGWEEGIPGMKVGERRKLTIPPALAYGAAGDPPRIPPNSILTFDVELMEVK